MGQKRKKKLEIGQHMGQYLLVVPFRAKYYKDKAQETKSEKVFFVIT